MRIRFDLRSSCSEAGDFAPSVGGLTSLFLLLFLGGVATLNSGFGASVLGLLVSAKAEVGL